MEADTREESVGPLLLPRLHRRRSDPGRPRYYPRTATFKTARVQAELQRMLKHAEDQGLPRETVDSVYLQGDEAIKAHLKRNGYDKTHGPAPIVYNMQDYLKDE